MNLQDDFIDALNQSIDEYELVAVCYRELLRYKKDTDNIFITRIGHLAEDPFQFFTDYSIIVATRPDPTVLPPSRIANVRPCSIAMG